jgi:hypothetical protein
MHALGERGWIFAGRPAASTPPTLPLLAPADLPWVTAWTDDAGSHLASCGIARAAWAVHFGPGQRSWSGSVCGPQSVQRLSSLPRSYRPPFRPGLCSSSRTRSMLPAASSVSVGGSGRPNGSTQASGICCGLRQRRVACRPAGCLLTACNGRD